MATLQAKSKWRIEETSFFCFINSLPTKADTTIQVFDHGEFYSVHGKDTLTAANIVFNSQASIKNIKNKNGSLLPTLYLSKLNFESLARNLLLVLHYRLEIYHMEHRDKWSIAYKASPGNLMEVQDLLFQNVDLMSTSSAIIAVKYKNEGGQLLVGVGFIDTSLCEMKYAEFNDNDYFSNLESIILQLGPKECIISKLDSSVEAKKLQEIVKRSGVLLTEKAKSDFTAKAIDQDLQRLIKANKKNGSNCEVSWCGDSVLASSCIAALIAYLELLSKEEKFGQFVIDKYDVSQYVLLDSAASSALNLFSNTNISSSQQRQPADSIYNLLNHCQTSQGQRLLSRWVKQPLIDINHLEERLGAVQSFVECSEMRQCLANDHLKKLPDFEKLSKKFHSQKAGLQDCYRTYQAVKQLPFICETLEKHSESLEENHQLLKEMFVTPIHELYKSFEKFMEMLDTTLDFDMVQKHEFLVKSDFDPELQRLRTKMNEVEAQMEKVFVKAAGELDLEAGKTLKLELSPQFGHVFRVTCKEEKNLRHNKKFTTLDTNKGGVRFINSRLQDLNSDYQESKEAYEGQQNAVVKEIVAIASGYAEPLHSLGDVVAKLDVLTSFAQAAVFAPTTYVRPKLFPAGTGSNRINLVQCRHPCVEIQDGISFIPNDVLLEKEKHNFIIVTGPNMGGKSTYIRQAGVAVLMAQIGSFVPCSSAEITIVDAILARVGAGDCQVEGVSTFMSEMLETAAILRSATKNSLVIIDELGRGTSTYDGFGLAWAISRKISEEIQAACLFATHFDEMTALADEVESVVNYHVTALTDVNEDGQSNLTMLYQVKSGSCDRSFGIHVAQCVGFPQNVIDSAKRKAAELEDCFVASSIDDDDQTSKKRRKIKQDGEAIIKNVLQSIRDVDWSQLSAEEGKSKLSQLRTSVLEANNEFVNGLLKRKPA